ncbi:DUF3108 domain-containing protein [Neisseria montereyensis]|uniref:DUF3108 domain-containing protein n=1 Tax=Neisseria montereyensis TaxID=2973938 RepID=A0ABT2FBR5_9NEIS|nr:DUF3108 domain-containing protein [Neisseria montereyensis]MCS4533588.1 DUF3108 domain-containing protein [Neisseria montereyensis]
MKTVRFSLLALALSAPTFAAELPQSAELHYSGNWGVPAVMTFNRSGNNYKITSNIKVPLYSIRFESGGNIAGNRLIPSYYKDVRKGKTYAEARFGGGKVTYGKTGEQNTEAMTGPTMDLFTLAWQLAANDAKLPAGLRITNGKKIYKVSGLNRTGGGQYKIGSGSTPINKYSLKRGDKIINYAFAPDFYNIPAQISYTDDGKTYNLKLTSVKINGREMKP